MSPVMYAKTGLRPDILLLSTSFESDQMACGDKTDQRPEARLKHRGDCGEHTETSAVPLNKAVLFSLT